MPHAADCAVCSDLPSRLAAPQWPLLLEGGRLLAADTRLPHSSSSAEQSSLQAGNMGARRVTCARGEGAEHRWRHSKRQLAALQDPATSPVVPSASAVAFLARKTSDISDIYRKRRQPACLWMMHSMKQSLSAASPCALARAASSSSSVRTCTAKRACGVACETRQEGVWNGL